MSMVSKTEFEILDLYHERVNLWLRHKSQVESRTVEVAKAEEAARAAKTEFNDFDRSRRDQFGLRQQLSHEHQLCWTELENKARELDGKVDLLRQWQGECEKGKFPETYRRAGVLAQLSEMVQEGWEIVSFNGVQRVAGESVSAGNIFVLLRRVVPL